MLPRSPVTAAPARPSPGARVTGVDDSTFSSTGESFSAIILPNAENTASKKLQSDDVSLAYEFSKKERFGPSPAF